MDFIRARPYGERYESEVWKRKQQQEICSYLYFITSSDPIFGTSGPQTTLRTCLTGSYNRLTRTPPYKTFFNTWEKHGNIGTNSYIEGWHNRMNQRASYRHQLQFYLPVKFQHSEAMLAKLQVELVSQAKLPRIQRKRYRDMQSKIIKLWDRFDNDEIDSYR